MREARLIRRPGADAVEMGEIPRVDSGVAVPEKRVVGKSWKSVTGVVRWLKKEAGESARAHTAE